MGSPLRGRSGLLLLLLALAALLVGVRQGMREGWFRSPFRAPGVWLAWVLAEPEAAYNFAEVSPGRLYRSAEPDERFLVWLQREYGIRHVIGLSGEVPVHESARRLGMRVTTYDWPSRKLPPWDELEALAARLGGDEPVLVHCRSGSDRTGWALAVYRVLREGWTLERAEREMIRFGHEPERYPDDHRALRERLEAP